MFCSKWSLFFFLVANSVFFAGCSPSSEIEPTVIDPGPREFSYSITSPISESGYFIVRFDVGKTHAESDMGPVDLYELTDSGVRFVLRLEDMAYNLDRGDAVLEQDNGLVVMISNGMRGMDAFWLDLNSVVKTKLADYPLQEVRTSIPMFLIHEVSAVSDGTQTALFQRDSVGRSSARVVVNGDENYFDLGADADYLYLLTDLKFVVRYQRPDYRQGVPLGVFSSVDQRGVKFNVVMDGRRARLVARNIRVQLQAAGRFSHERE